MFSFSRVARSKSFPNITERKFYSSDVRRYLADALTGYEETVFMPLCCRNWHLGDNFSKARITTVQYLKDEFGRRREPSSVNKNDIKRGKVKTHLIPFSSMFRNGFHALECFNNRTSITFEDNIQVEKAHNNRYLLQYALDAFVTGFLCEKDHHEECLRKILTIDNETEISVIMANHLFSRLTAPRVVNYYGMASLTLWCSPIGGVNCSIVIPPKPEDESAEYSKEPNISKDKHIMDFNSDELSLREKNSGLPIPLWDGPFNNPPLYRLNTSSVLKLWMIINHASIQPSLSLEDNQLLSGTCDFKGRLPKDVNIESTLEMKDKFQPMEEQELTLTS
ncbi:unnamed protein product [Mytilus edulis]|uniref:Uncharacterized protein n=1 Tax=Mytilus edulis TaxID=6550 RepID=A0A8S3PW94_MYTED|nr:unnamed protein product [Mytilus edulis]